MALWNRPPPSICLLLSLIFAALCRAGEVKYAPALYSGDFGNCLAGQSPFTITELDILYDAGNKTLVFHVNGTSAFEDEPLLVHLSIDASRGVLPVGDDLSVDELPNAVFQAADFEGSARLQIYARTSGTELGCFQAALTNGKTLSHPVIIAPILGAFTLIAIAASFITAAYGVSIPHMRMHHAHSLPVFVVFETFQAIFFSGALEVSWPSVLTAWWSNFAWSAGLIYSHAMFRSIDIFAGVTSNASQIGDLSSLETNTGNGSGSRLFAPSTVQETSQSVGQGTYNSSFLTDYTWSRGPVAPGMPLPGTWSGFPSVLSAVDIPIVDAFMVGLVWLLIAIGLVALTVGSLKISLDGLARAGRMKEDRLAYFRSHWAGYLGHAMLRTLVIAFFPVMTLAMLQFTIRVSAGAIAVAAVVFVVVLVGILSLVASACRTRTQDGKTVIVPDRIVLYRGAVRPTFPRIGVVWDSTLRKHALDVRPLLSVPLFRIRHDNTDPDRPTVHMDKPFIKKFGSLSARYRRTRWWYLAYHVGYLFCRAAFLGAGWQSPRAQVSGVLVTDVVNFGIGIILNPFEGARNAAMAVWILGVCKISTTALSIAFLPELDLARSTAATLGLVIIAVQGLTVAALLVLIVLSAVSSCMSLTRNREEINPDWLEPARVRYFEKMEKKARDARFEEETPEPAPPTPRFSVISVRRKPKIEDEDECDEGDDATGTNQPPARGRDRHSRTSSAGLRLSTGSLPRTARPYRASWSSRDFGDPSLSRPSSVVAQRLSGATCVVVTDCDASNNSSVALVRPQSSLWSLNTPSASRASSPSPVRLSRETVMTTADGRRPPTALPEDPEPQDQI
ncbi:2932c7a6-fcf9-480b-bdc4-eb4fb4e8bd16 [Thermothielavioides terrestris]|uniref:2932c7a6-fcf9-480b-bdc4-eb4fb4e8bd16 n=1 Tax=Thermothielavioides terrestris TaxID=2587410 RepID=A0A446BB37_9PEZI|nr:2932c7a6-fcf9-480b-bdc4-eb4fb4e8bd16 [Thermothielavioides terrestris]